jgi:cyanophycin synthetase
VVRACAAGAVDDAARRMLDAEADLRERFERDRLDASTRLIAEAARRRGIPVRRVVGDRAVQLGLGATRRLVDGALTAASDAAGVALAADRARVHRLLDRLGVPVPEGDVAGSAREAMRIADDVGTPVVIAPLDAARRPSTPVTSDGDVRAAFEGVGGEETPALVLHDPPGRDHVVLVVAGRVLGVVEHDAAPGAPAAFVDRTADMHPANAALCAFAADVVGLAVAGVHVRSTDVAVPFRDNGGVVLGVDARPDLAAQAGADAAADAVLDLLFPPAQPSAIPLVAVTGTNGKTTTTRLIAHLFRTTGARVGFSTTDGVYYQEHALLHDDMTGPVAADMVLSNPRVDVAVLETARGGMLRVGLGFDACDVAVVLNVSPDHLGMLGVQTVEDLADVKALLPSVVRPTGFAVLNADEPLVARMRTPGRVAPFTLGLATESALVVAQIAAGVPALSVEHETFVLHRDGARVEVAAVVDVPLTMGGAARFQVQNVAAAILAAACGGVPIDTIRLGLASFAASAAMTPGRMNQLQVRGATIILDYAHNVAAVGALVDYALRVPAARRIAALHAPGDRRDEDIRAVGALGAPLDVVILKEDPTIRRGRAPGETIRLLREGLDAAGTRALVIEALDETLAAAALLDLLREGDLAIFVAADAPAVIAMLRAPDDAEAAAA